MNSSLHPRMQNVSGTCVCGSVRISATASPLRITICHCLWCQQRTGSAFGVEAVFNQSDVSIAGDSLERYIHHSDESMRWIEQKFCAGCGSNVGLTLEVAPRIQSIAAGIIDDPSILQDDALPIRHVFTRSARPWVSIPAHVEQFDAYFTR